MYIGDYFKNIGVGAGSDRLKIDEKGQILLEGGASGFEDQTTSLKGKLLASTAGKADWDYDRHACKFQSGGSIATAGDKVGDENQYPHGAKTDGDVFYHVHWFQTDTYANMPVQFTFRWRLHSNGAEEETSWTTAVVEANPTNNAFTYTAETSLLQITRLDTVDMTGASISALIDWEFARTDSETGDIYVKYVDPHVELDTIGSNTEYVKAE